MSALLERIPPANQRRIALHVTPAGERALRQGHPWLYADSIRQQSHAGQSGDYAVIFDKKDRFMAIGLYDPDSPVRVKILHQGQSAKIDAGWFAARIQQAAALRETLTASDTTGYRLIYGENDGFPGLIADHYTGTLVIKLYTAIWLPHLHSLLPILANPSPEFGGGWEGVQRIVLRLSRNMQAGNLYGLQDGMVLYGEPLTAPVKFTENGLNFEADVQRGHKTGFFFDQRNNRAFVAELARGKRVLDVFASSGAFSLYAASGGATEILSIDISAPALEAARRNFALNRHLPAVASAKHSILTADAFESLERLNRERQQFDMVILDPPSFAVNSEQISRALDAYRRLVRLALPCVVPGGVFVMASCSSRVSADDFFNTVQETARHSGYRLEEIRRTGHAIDHPVRFPEGAYLKCLFARVEA